MTDIHKWATTKRFVNDPPRMEPTAAASFVDDDDALLVSGFGSVGDPKVIPETLANSERDLSLTIVSGGSTGPNIDRELVKAKAVARRYPFQAQSSIRQLINKREIHFQDLHIARLGEAVETESLINGNVAIIEALAVGDNWLIPTTSIGHTSSYVSAADKIIVEVNHEQPLALQQIHDVYCPGLPPNRKPIPLDWPGDRIGGPQVRFEADKLVAVVESDRRDTPYTFREPTPTDEAIIENVVEFLSDEIDRNPVISETLTLQFGVGSLGNALMKGVDTLQLSDTDIVYYGEVIQDGLLDLIDNGMLEVASATSLAMSVEGQERLFDNIEQYAEKIILRPANISNRAELIDRFGVVAINSALEVDIFGHVNSTHIDGRDIVSGVGGSGDFNQNSHLAVIALPSEVNEDRSRIVPHAPHIDHTSHEIDVVVTEQGVADLRGKSPYERATALVENCAHPNHHDALYDYLEQACEKDGHIPFDPVTAFDWLD